MTASTTPDDMPTIVSDALAIDELVALVEHEHLASIGGAVGFIATDDHDGPTLRETGPPG